MRKKILVICSIFHVFGNSKNLAFTMAALVVLVTLIPLVLLGIDIELSIEQVDWILSFEAFHAGMCEHQNNDSECDTPWRVELELKAHLHPQLPPHELSWKSWMPREHQTEPSISSTSTS